MDLVDALVNERTERRQLVEKFNKLANQMNSLNRLILDAAETQGISPANPDGTFGVLKLILDRDKKVIEEMNNGTSTIQDSESAG